MSSSSEPEKYSIDEMMERLKTPRPAEEVPKDGELVVREDGSQAIRVRKRKRRSNQPHKAERQQMRRSRMFQVSASLIVLLFVAFGIGLAIIHANSAPFREGLIKKITQCTGASVELERFRMNPARANADRLSLTWPGGNALGNLTLININADISPASFMGKSMSGEEVTAPEGRLILRVPEPDQPVRESVAVDGSLIDFKCYSTPKFAILLGKPDAPLARVDGTEATFQPSNANDRAQLLLNRGDITIPGWPKFRMDRSHIEFRGQTVKIVGLRLWSVEESVGFFELAGTVSPYAADRTSTLDVALESFPLAGITGADFGRLFSGRIDTVSAAKSNLLVVKFGDIPTSSLVVSFTGSLTSPMVVGGFPFLFGLSQTLGDDWFKHPEFESVVSGVLRRAEGRVLLSDFTFESKGRLTLRGVVTMAADQKLSGSLEVGVATGMVEAARNPRLDSMFGPVKGGLRWVTIKIEGTPTAPLDNFRQLYEAASAKRQTSSDPAIPSFEELTAPK